jgi:hypothetical protein
MDIGHKEPCHNERCVRLDLKAAHDGKPLSIVR